MLPAVKKRSLVVSKRRAVNRLVIAGHRTTARRLKHWHNRRGENAGWDGWLRGRRPDLVDIVWT